MKCKVEQGADSEEEVATTQPVNTQNTIPSKFTRIGRKATAPANPLGALQKYIFVISIPPSPQIR